MSSSGWSQITNDDPDKHQVPDPEWMYGCEKVEPKKVHQQMFLLNYQEVFLDDDPDRALDSLEKKINSMWVVLAVDQSS